MADPLTGLFAKPFPEQVAALRLRLGNLVPTQAWDDMMRAAHNSGFMVAGAQKADLLADLARAVDAAVSEGETLDQFRKRFRSIVEKHGWHGWTGEGTKRGEAWRTKVIYKTNLATSYAAGRHAQLIEGKFKYWIYRHGNSEHPRLVHLSWDGLVLEPDHPFWTTHMPVNDWGCRCRVFGARSLTSARLLGGDPSKSLPDNWRDLDPKTGAPTGIGKGWDYAPGGNVIDTVRALRDKLEVLPLQPSVDLIQSWITQGPFEAWKKAPEGAWPLVRISAVEAERIGAQRVVADFSVGSLGKQMRKHPDMTVEDYAFAQSVVENATYRVIEGGKAIIYIWQAPGTQGLTMIVKATRTGKGLFVESYRKFSSKDPAARREVQRLIGKGDLLE